MKPFDHSILLFYYYTWIRLLPRHPLSPSIPSETRAKGGKVEARSGSSGRTRSTPEATILFSITLPNWDADPRWAV